MPPGGRTHRHPAPNGLLDPVQLYLLDQGERLGKTITGYRDKYFTPGKRNGHVVFNYNLKTDEKGKPSPYEKEIYDKIGDICISMKAKDYLELPDRIDRINNVVLRDTVMQQYLEFEKKLILSLENVEDISTANAAGFTNKLLQFTNRYLCTMQSTGGTKYTTRNLKPWRRIWKPLTEIRCWCSTSSNLIWSGY